MSCDWCGRPVCEDAKACEWALRDETTMTVVLPRSVTLTAEEADWLASEVSRASTDTLVPGAAERLRALARKLRGDDE